MFSFTKDKIKSTGIDYMIVGLGNPGKEYENTRHNAGFIAIDEIAAQHSATISRIKFKGLCGECRMADKRVLLLKPSTFMNLSGQSVIEAMNFYKLPPENVLILFDDISLEPGKIRIRRKGSDGGHNGIKNIIYLSGKDNFPRIKIGVGAKPHPEYDLAAWVLSRFTTAERKEMESAAKNTVKAAELMVNGDIDQAMSVYNQK
ncbi:aminoacyl-tRNA hydrolase [Scatolibacter rhodanostii]|uniref:aminoacyl-tRNA hydrolase n=1 Tax=Scatolibacter rhodanostii TaxID=2014781 RepID=UPI000C07461E|nr:aminoacyl-tRNA hydrolase [Scatolibacter rhodanostii]